VDSFLNFIDNLDMMYWVVILILLFSTSCILYIFYMIRSKKELEYLEYEIKENEQERLQYAKMREDLRKF